MNRPKYLSLTGISSILTAHILPVSAQVAQTPMQVHFAPQIGHSATDQSQVHINHHTAIDQAQVHVHQHVIQNQSQPLNWNHVHAPTTGISQDFSGSINSTTVHDHGTFNQQNTQAFANGIQTVNNSAQATSNSGQSPNQSSPVVMHHGFFGHHMSDLSNQSSNSADSINGLAHGYIGQAVHHGSEIHSALTAQGSSTHPTNSGFSLLHHLHHNNAVSNQSYTNSGHTQGQIQQQNQSPTSTAIVAPHEHHLQWQNNGPISGNNTINLDLSSSAQVATLGHQLNNVSVMIQVGGAQMQVTSSTQLTAAEKVAALQVMSTGQQGLILDAKGTADGGSMSITPWLANHLGNLIIPSGVSVTDVSKVGSLTIHGSLTDSGNLYITSSNPSANTVTLNASNIAITSGAGLSNVLPSATTASVTNPVNFNISSLNDITNAGSVNSSGGLLLSAGGSIVNAAQGADAAVAGVVQAVNNITITSGSGSITNGGLVESAAGNITLATASPSTNLNINAAGGTFQADRAAINIQPASYVGSAQANINGGNYLSQQLNLNGGAGTVTANIGQVSGVVNTTAGDAHFEAASTALQLGTINIAGDPTYYNSLGPASLSGALNVAGDLAIVTRGDITSNFDLTTTAGSGQVGNLTLIAGSTFSATPPYDVSPDSTTTITLSNASPPDIGGSVQINGNLTSSGNITVVANNGLLSTGYIDITGTTKTSGGNVTMISGATSGTGITTGGIQTNGASGAGNVTLLTATPVISGSGTLTILNGTVTGGYTTTGLPTNNATITTGNILAAGSGGAIGVNGGAGGSINITAGSNLTTGYVQAYGGGGGGGQDQFSQAGNGGSGGSVALTSSAGDITVNGVVNTSGGGGGGGGGSLAMTGAPGGNGGNIAINGSTIVTVNGPILAASGGSGGLARSNASAGGAAGGGSFGGGGGGGYTGYPGASAGGGGGGLFGGGGSGLGSTVAISAGSGGGIAGGAGGVPAGQTGSAGKGGNGGDAPFSGLAGGAFGQPGTSAVGDIAAAAAGSSGAGGTVTVTAGRQVAINKTIADLGAAYASPYSNESIDARGSNGSINVTVLTPISNVYLADAKYDAGASTYLAPTAGVYSKGDWAANTILVTTPTSTFTGASTATAAQISTGGSTETLLEGTANVVVKPGDFVTPAEYIAFLQAAGAGQTLQLGQAAAGTTPGTGYATGGNFAVAASNIPSGNFTNLVLPSNVVENVSAPSLTYTGSGAVSGTINTTGTQLIFGTDLSLSGTGAINFNAPSGGTLNAYSSITGAGNTLVSVTNPSGVLSLVTSNPGPAAGNIQLNTSTPNMQFSSSGAVTLFDNQAVNILSSSGTRNVALEATLGDLTVAGNVVTGNNLSLITDQTGKSILESSGTLTAGSNLSLVSAGGIGQTGAPILTHASYDVVSTNGAVFVNDSITGTFAQTANTTIASGVVTETGVGQTLTVGDSSISMLPIVSSGNFVASATGAGSNIVAGNSITVANAGAKIDLSTTGTGSITQTTGRLTANNVVLSTGSNATAGGSIGSIAVVASGVTVGTNAIDNTSGSATITNTTPGASTIGTTSAVNNLTYTATGAGTSIGINAVDAKNNVMITDVLGTAGGIAINGIVNAGSTIALYTAGSGDITQGNTGASLNADSVQLITTGGNIGNGAQNGTILVSASNVYLGSDPGKYLSGSGNAFIQDAISGSVYASPAFGHDSSSLGSLNVIDLGSSASVNGYIFGDTTVQGVEGNNTSISASLQSFDTITLKATGTGTIGGSGQDYITNLTTDTGDASFTLIQTSGGINLNVGGNANITSNDFSFLNGSVGGTLQFTSGQYDPTYIGTVLVGSGLSTISGAAISVGTLTAAPGGSVQLTTIPGFFYGGGISGGGTITADSVHLTTSSQFDIGTSASPINLVTQEFSASGNNIYLSNTGNATVDSLTFGGTQAALSNVGTLNIMGLTGTNTNPQNIRADIRASGAITVSGPIAISASSNSNSSLQFASTTTGDPITVINNAAITASNGSGNGGVIAFNGGMTGTVSLGGTGTVNADTYVAFGNIDPVTLVPIDGQVVPNTASFVNGLVSFSQSAPIGNQIFVAPLVPPPPTPPQPPAVVVVPTGSGGANGGLGDSFFGVGGFGIPITTTASSALNQNDEVNQVNQANLASQLAYAQHLVQQLLFNLGRANPDLALGNPFNTLNEQIGTRIATDYTPNVFPVTRRFPDLEGGVEVIEKLSEIPGQAIFGVSEFNATELSILTNQGVQYGQNSKDQYLNLMKGFVLFAPDKDITVEVREGTVHIPKGCIAWIMETGADSAIYDLHDSLSTGAVRVVVNNKEIKMGPGTQLLLTRDMKSSFGQLNPGASVGYRNVRSTDMGNGIRTFVADFSIAHGLENLEVLHSLFYSQDPKHRKLVAQMLKNAAILASLTGGNESYKTGASR